MKVTDYIITALRDQGTSHCFVDLGGLNDNFMPPLADTGGIRTVVAAFEGGAAYMANGFAVPPAMSALPRHRRSRRAQHGDGAGGGRHRRYRRAGAGNRPVAVGLVQGRGAASPAPHHHLCGDTAGGRAPVGTRDVQKAELDYDWKPVPHHLRAARFVDQDALDAAVNLMNDAGNRNIVILAGPGVLHTDGIDALRGFAKRFDIPVATTLSGKGLLSDDHPLSLGVFGYGGSRWAIDAIRSDEVDILLVVGSDLSQRDTMQWDPKMLPSKALMHIDADPLLIGRTWSADIPIVANPAAALAQLAQLGDAAGLEAGRAERRSFLNRIRKSGPRRYQTEDMESDAIPMHPGRVVAELRAAFPDNSVLCVDSGAHRAWCAEYWGIRQPATHFSLTNLGPMGGAIPLGIGAKLARPERPLMVVTGDDCMLMHSMEVQTAAREKVPMVIAIMNNQSYGNIYFRASKMGPGPERLTAIPGIDWVGFARSMGAEGERIERPDKIAAAVGWACDHPGPYILDLHTDKTYPTPVGVWRDRQ